MPDWHIGSYKTYTPVSLPRFSSAEPYFKRTRKVAVPDLMLWMLLVQALLIAAISWGLL